MNSRLSGSPDLSLVANSQGLRWSEFRSTLTLKPHVVLFNILCCWLLIVSAFVSLSVMSAGAMSYFLVPLLAIWVAFWLASYMSHFHEAAHFNLSRSRKLNDVLANVFFMPFIGLEIKSYRRSHWRHHLFLATVRDSEISYFDPLSFANLLEGLTGVYLLKSGLRYLFTYGAGRADADDSSTRDVWRFLFGVACFLSTQVIICAVLLFLVGPSACLVWLLAVFVFVPFLGRIRQTLEHRSFEAAVDSKYTEQGLAPTNRMFGRGFVASHFGGSGFNRHLLHHWDPGVSYTRFDEMEEFLMDSPLCRSLDESRTTYYRALITMLGQK